MHCKTRESTTSSPLTISSILSIKNSLVIPNPSFLSSDWTISIVNFSPPWKSYPWIRLTLSTMLNSAVKYGFSMCSNIWKDDIKFFISKLISLVLPLFDNTADEIWYSDCFSIPNSLNLFSYCFFITWNNWSY